MDDVYDEPYWNLQQLVAWVYTGDRWAVCQLADDVRVHGSYWQEHTMSDGREELTLVVGKKPGANFIAAVAAYKGGAALSSMEEAYRDVARKLRNDFLRCTGVPDADGDPREITPIQWAYLKIGEDRGGCLHVIPRNPGRGKIASWGEVKFLRSDVLNIWPDPLAESGEHEIDSVKQGKGRPSDQARIEGAYANLRDNNEIDFGQPQARVVENVLKSLTPKPGKSTVEQYVGPMFNADKAGREQHP